MSNTGNDKNINESLTSEGEVDAFFNELGVSESQNLNCLSTFNTLPLQKEVINTKNPTLNHSLLHKNNNGKPQTILRKRTNSSSLSSSENVINGCTTVIKNSITDLATTTKLISNKNSNSNIFSDAKNFNNNDNNNIDLEQGNDEMSNLLDDLGSAKNIHTTNKILSNNSQYLEKVQRRKSSYEGPKKKNNLNNKEYCNCLYQRNLILYYFPWLSSLLCCSCCYGKTFTHL